VWRLPPLFYRRSLSLSNLRGLKGSSRFLSREAIFLRGTTRLLKRTESGARCFSLRGTFLFFQTVFPLFFPPLPDHQPFYPHPWKDSPPRGAPGAVFSVVRKCSSSSMSSPVSPSTITTSAALLRRFILRAGVRALLSRPSTALPPDRVLMFSKRERPPHLPFPPPLFFVLAGR